MLSSLTIVAPNEEQSMARHRGRRNGPGTIRKPEFPGWTVNPAEPPEVKLGDLVVLRSAGNTLYVTLAAIEGEQCQGECFTGLSGSSGVGRGDAVTFERRHVFRVSKA
jgi:hypothetical protein